MDMVGKLTCQSCRVYWFTYLTNGKVV